MRLVLYQPEIAGNVGAAIRAAACFGAGVDIVEPCGFPPDDKVLKRAAMDYGALAPPVRHASWAAYLESPERRSGRLVLLSTRAETSIWEADLREDDLLVIGRESAGVPPEVRAACDLSVRIPLAEGARSLNAAAAAAIALADMRRRSAGGARRSLHERGRTPRVIFHIGHPKTATSYLQQAIALNRKRLEAIGFRAPTRFRHVGDYDHETLARLSLVGSGNAQALFFALEKGDTSILDAYDAYADGERDLILSCELFFYRPDLLAVAAQYFRELGYALHFIVYLPRYERAVISGFAQNVKNLHFRGDIPAFIAGTESLRLFRFAELLDDIEARCRPERFSVRSFDKRLLRGGDVWTDFLAEIGADGAAASMRPAGRANESLPVAVLEGLRRLHPQRHARLRRLLRDTPGLVVKRRPDEVFDYYYTRDVRKLVSSQYDADRARLIERWFSGDPAAQAFWRELPPAPGKGPRPEPGLAALIRAGRSARRQQENRQDGNGGAAADERAP